MDIHKSEIAMPPSPVPADEAARLAQLKAFDILDTPAERDFDDLAVLATQITDTPMALISLVDSDRQWCKSHIGCDLKQTPRDVAFCAHTIMEDLLMVVPDATLDPRFCNNPLVSGGPQVRFYAGTPLRTPEGHALGSLCVIDVVPRELSESQRLSLIALGRQVVSQMQLRSSMKQLQHESLHDALTGLPNRVLFTERVNRSIGVASHGNYCFAVLFLDLDRFKVVNDSLGHAAGDALLRTISKRIKSNLRTSDTLAISIADDASPVNGESTVNDDRTVARMGGDEFTLLLENIDSPSDAARVAERALSLIAQPVSYDGQEITTTASIGIVVCGKGGTVYSNAKDLLRDADAAMYKAKAAGKAQYVIFNRRMHSEAVRRMDLETELRHALSKNEFKLHYQPIISLRTGRVSGFEALLRWKYNGQMVSPVEFIPVAEDIGLIIPIGRWVLHEACRQLTAWTTAGPVFEDLSMSINVSRHQLADSGLIDELKRALGQSGVRPGAISLEITEGSIMHNPSAAREMMNRMKQTGVQLSMDDFGTGHSSLSCLHRFPIDVLKLDQSFVMEMQESREAALVQKIVQLAHCIGLKVIAEGIEKPEQAAALQAWECDFVQGFHYGRPMEPANVEAFVRKHNQTAAAAA